MIDDAAQSFGARINDRLVGTFGNAGLISFSPGKPLTGSMGSFFWEETDTYYITYKRPSKILHNIAFWDFYYNRYHIYEYKKYKVLHLFSLLNRLLQKRIDISEDGMASFEKKHILSSLTAFNEGKLSYKQNFVSLFSHLFGETECFRIVKCQRGVSSNHKIVLVFNTKERTSSFRDYMRQMGIYTSGGYKILDSKNSNNYKNARNLQGRIVELPVENSSVKMDYLFEKVNAFIK